MGGRGGGEPQYVSKDFAFEDLRRDVEADAAYRHHLHADQPPPPSSPPPPDASQAWTSFHKRHITGRFFKEIRYLLKEFPELQGTFRFAGGGVWKWKHGASNS